MYDPKHERTPCLLPAFGGEFARTEGFLDRDQKRHQVGGRFIHSFLPFAENFMVIENPSISITNFRSISFAWTAYSRKLKKIANHLQNTQCNSIDIHCCVNRAPSRTISLPLLLMKETWNIPIQIMKDHFPLCMRFFHQKPVFEGCL